MSDFMNALVDLLPEHNSLKNKNNDLFKVLDKSVGEWFDNYNILDFYNQLFLTTATGKYLDLHGKDYGITRKNFESDDDYRNRIIISSLKHLTPAYLKVLYDLELYVNVPIFNIKNNDLTSNNPYINQHGYMAENKNNIMDSIKSKFIIDAVFSWIFEGEESDYIIDMYDDNIIGRYRDIYSLNNCQEFFSQNNNIQTVKLNLSNATNCNSMFSKCTNLTSINLKLANTVYCNSLFLNCSSLMNVDLNVPLITEAKFIFDSCTSLTSINLDLPNVTQISHLFDNCINLTEVTLNIPQLRSFGFLFDDSSKLKYINLIIPQNSVNLLVRYIQDLELEYLETLIINGEEVDLT